MSYVLDANAVSALMKGDPLTVARLREAFGELKATLERRGSRIEDFDAAIAAHALARGSVLVTPNLAHMIRVPGVRVEDWAK